MRIYLVVAMFVLPCCGLFAQSNQPSAQSGGMSGMKMGAGEKSQRLSGMHQKMQADMQQMKAQIDKMRADAQKVEDSNTKTALLDNADMWEQFMTRMQSHMKMMQGMHHDGMTGMHHKKAPSDTGTTPKPE